MQWMPRSPRMRIRTLGPGEDAVVRHVFNALSPRSRELRFHRPVHRISDRLLARLAEVDGRHRVVLAAEARRGGTWEPVGIGHIAGLDDQRAEIAIAVVDGFHGHGIGRRLLTALRDTATELGYERVEADALADNDPILHLLKSVLPTALLRRIGDVVHVTAYVGTAFTITHEDLMQDLLGVA